MANLYPEITFRVKTYDIQDLNGQLLPDSRENIIKQLESATVWVLNWPYPLKHNDTFTLNGKQAIETLKNYNQIGTANNVVLETLYYGIPTNQTPNYSSGLYGKRYNGYFDDNMSWWNTATLQGDTNLTTQIDAFTSDDDLYSWMWLGYFYAPSSGTYTFYTTSDDASYLWIGDNAISGYTALNATVNNGGPHGSSTESGTVNLIGGTYYPMRIMFGEDTGGDVMTVEFEGPDISRTSDGLNFYFGGLEFWNQL